LSTENTQILFPARSRLAKSYPGVLTSIGGRATAQVGRVRQLPIRASTLGLGLYSEDFCPGGTDFL